MKTSFDDWLQQLAAAGKGGSAISEVDRPQGTRGEELNYPISLAGDWTGAVISASASAAPDAPSPLVTFAVSSASYDAPSGKTFWTATLVSGTGANSTGALPSDTDGDGVEHFPALFRITPSGGTQTTLFGTALTITGKA